MLPSNYKQLLSSKNKFIPTAIETHNNKYNYSKVNYINANTKVEIICKIHGSFWQIPRFHIRKNNPTGCPKCNGGVKHTQTYFIQKASEIHNNIYDYSLVEYIDSAEKVKIICKKHGIFEQQPRNHIFKQGCPKCKNSKGEYAIEKYLSLHNITHIQQHTFNDCRGKKRPLPFDFYLPNNNICIEFQGEQHFRPAFGDSHFKNIQFTDNIKEQYCINNSIKLLKINYYEIESIDKILNENIFYSF